MPPFFRAPAHSRVDTTLVIALMVDAALLAGLSWGSPHAAAGQALAAVAAVAGLWCAGQPIDRWHVRPAFAAMLVAIVLAQLAVAADPQPWVLNVLLTLSLLPALQRGGLVLAAGTAFVVGGLPLLVARGPLPAVTDPTGLVDLGVVGAQTLLLARITQRSKRVLPTPVVARDDAPDAPTRSEVQAGDTPAAPATASTEASQARRLAAAVIQTAAQAHPPATASSSPRRGGDTGHVTLS